MRMCVRMYVRVYDCLDSTSDTRRTHTTGTRAAGKERNTGKHKNKICYCGEIYTPKMKKVKKSLEITKKAVTLQKKQQNNNYAKLVY